jgi:hypothetical protein
MEYGTHEIDQEVVLNEVTYQVNGYYTKTLTHEEKDERGNIIFSEDETALEIESVTYGEDFELNLTDHKILKELESESHY